MLGGENGRLPLSCLPPLRSVHRTDEGQDIAAVSPGRQMLSWRTNRLFRKLSLRIVEEIPHIVVGRRFHARPRPWAKVRGVWKQRAPERPKRAQTASVGHVA